MRPLATAEERARAREQLGLPLGARVVVHLGWDWHRKGGDLFAGAAAQLAHREDLVLLTVGGGEPGERALAELGLNDRVRVVPPIADAARLYAAADVLVSPSRDEGMPFSMIEALSRGSGVVATRLPGQLYVGRDLDAVRFTGFDAGEIAAAVLDLLARDPATLAADARAGHERVAASMDLEVWGRNLMERYRRHAQVRRPDDRSTP